MSKNTDKEREVDYHRFLDSRNQVGLESCKKKFQNKVLDNNTYELSVVDSDSSLLDYESKKWKLF